MGVPGGLKVTATGPDFLEFGWEAVEGATGYEIQLSRQEGDFSTVATASVSTTTHRFEVAPETTGWARVRAWEGDRQGEWSETAMGASRAAPLVIGAPRPEVSGSGADFIEWSWEPVADALSYEVRVAATEEGLDAASPETVMETIMETMYRVAAEPEAEMVLRVRAVAGTTESPIVSEWSDAVSGMSDAAPRPFVVGMRPPQAGADRECSGQALCPDDGTDPAKAMASVNPMMLVSSSHRARVRPLFVEGAAGVTVEAGESLTPFVYTDWNLLQRRALDEGAAFEIRKITGGAGQEPTPTGDARFVTCGPFRCSEAAAEPPAAPEVTNDAICEAFEVDFVLQKGLVDNRHHLNITNGVDVGWAYTLSHPAKLTHEFTTISLATETGTMAVPGAALTVTSTPLALEMRGAPEDSPSRVNKFGLVQNRDSAWGTARPPAPIRNGFGATAEDSVECWARGGIHATVDWASYESVARSRGKHRGDYPGLPRPPWCFNLSTDTVYGTGGVPANQEVEIPVHDYLSGYRLHVDPLVGVSWAGSEVEWGDDDPFGDLRCDRHTFQVTDQLDLCADFRAEAEAFWGDGIAADGPFRVEYRLSGTDNTDGRLTHILVRHEDEVTAGEQNSGDEYRPAGSRHVHLWLADARPGRRGQFMGVDGTLPDKDLYRMYEFENAREQWAGVTDWHPVMSLEMFDEDSDPKYGDFGKIDLVGADGDPGSDGVPENYPVDEDPGLRCTDADGGAGCDAERDFDLSATFTRIRDTDDCTFTAEVSVTCVWDADGDRRRGGPTAFDTDRTNRNRFITCTPT